MLKKIPDYQDFNEKTDEYIAAVAGSDGFTVLLDGQSLDQYIRADMEADVVGDGVEKPTEWSDWIDSLYVFRRMYAIPGGYEGEWVEVASLDVRKVRWVSND